MLKLYIIYVQEGTVALMSAAYYGHMKIVRVLLAAGADINIQDKVSADPLDIHGCCKLACALIET